MNEFVKLIAMFFFGGVGSFFTGLGIVCCLEGHAWGCIDFFFWGTIALIAAIMVWKKPKWLFGWIIPDF